MALETSGEITVAVDRPTAFAIVRDPMRLARCIPGCTDVREVVPDRYTAVLTSQVAFMTLSFKVIVDVAKVEPPATLEATITGDAVGLSGHVVATARLDLAETPDRRTIVRYATQVGLTGKLGESWPAGPSRDQREDGAPVRRQPEGRDRTGRRGVVCMKHFELVEPATIDEAVAFLDPEDARVRAIAGGTALMLMMKARLFQPVRLVSLRRLNGALRGVRADGRGGLAIGAMTTLTELERSPEIASAGSGGASRAADAVERANPERGDARRTPRPRRSAHGSAADSPDAWRARARGEPPRRTLD